MLTCVRKNGKMSSCASSNAFCFTKNLTLATSRPGLALTVLLLAHTSKHLRAFLCLGLPSAGITKRGGSLKWSYRGTTTERKQKDVARLAGCRTLNNIRELSQSRLMTEPRRRAGSGKRDSQPHRRSSWAKAFQEDGFLLLPWDAFA